MSVQANNEEKLLDIKEDNGADGENAVKLGCLTSNQTENTVAGDVHLPPREFFHVFVWSVTLLLAFGFGRMLCIGHGNYEFCRTWQDSDMFDNMSVLLLMGITLCFFTGTHSAIRFNYLYGFSAETNYSGVLFLFVFFLTPIVWKGVDTTALKSFMFTASGLSNNIVPLMCVIILLLSTVGWHIYMAHQREVLIVYIISRSLVFLYLVLNIVGCINETKIKIHVHHYQLGWLLALFGCFNHPISVVTLAFGAGLFVEGLSTFGADSMFVPDLPVNGSKNFFWTGGTHFGP